MTTPIEALEARLRAVPMLSSYAPILIEAADALASQAATIRQMREALERIRGGKEVRDPNNPGSTIVVNWPLDVIDAICDAALQGGE